jgi:hypothetical protein
MRWSENSGDRIVAGAAVHEKQIAKKMNREAPGSVLLK